MACTNNFSNTNGLSATSISEITRVPRTTVLRKINDLEKNGMIKKDKHKRYTSDVSKKILSLLETVLLIKTSKKISSVLVNSG